MASPGNPPNQQPFDMHKLFKPSSSPPTPPPISNTSPFPPSSPSSSSSASYPPPTTTYSYPPQSPSPPFHLYSPILSDQHQRTISYPTPNLPPPNPNPGGARLMALLGSKPTSNLDPSQPNLPFSSPSSGAGGTGPEFSLPVNPPVFPSAPPGSFATPQPTPMRFPSSKLPKGRHLLGNHVVYDLDVRLPGEFQPQLEVTPITKYISDPGLVVGRQIAVNGTYICYGLKMGNIRVLNINTALRSLLRGHTQRVSDMAFFAEDVHLLASASVDRRVFIWKINECPDEEDKPQITGKIVIALQIEGEGDSMHPRVCWHCHKQEILVVAIGNHILKIDTTKVGKGEELSAETPLKCPIDKLIDGVQLVGKHNGEVTELSMCQWMTTRLASASTDGTVKIWEDRKAVPLAVLRPHDDQPVNSVTFLTSPHRPDHIILITAGPLNREVKIWTLAREEGWFLPSDAESWQCTQTLELRSSNASKIEDAFFNQVVALPQSGLLLLANAKKNAIYAVHIEYGPSPAVTRMDYIAEFTVTMPVLSLTGTSDSLPDGEHVVQVYCVQTQAIQQYALELSQCLPPPLESVELERTNSNVSRPFGDANLNGSATLELSNSFKSSEMPLSGPIPIPPILSTGSESAPIISCPVSLSSSEVTSSPEFATSAVVESKPSAVSSSKSTESFHTASPLPSSPRLSRQSSETRSPLNSIEPSLPSTALGGDQPVLDYSVDRRVDTVEENLADSRSSGHTLRKDEENVVQNDISLVPNSPIAFKHPTHLITPSELLSMASSSENTQITPAKIVGEAMTQDVVVNNDLESTEVEVKVVGEARGSQNSEFDYQSEPRVIVAEKKEKSFYSQASDLGIQMARDCHVGTYSMDRAQQAGNVTEARIQPNAGEDEVRDLTGNMSTKVGETTNIPTISQSPGPVTKGKRQKGKNSQVSGPSSPSPSPFNSTDSSNEQGSSSSAPSTDAAWSQLFAMQEMLDQLMSTQKEMQKQMNVMVSTPISKEGKRLEASLGRSMEKVVKANMDALWARFQEENAKHDKLERDRTQQMTNLIANYMNKDLSAILEKTLKKEIAAVGSAVARAITPILEKNISLAIAESFQKGVGDKAINQLERSVNSKLEATVVRQIQAQFQTSGKQALQDALKSSFEASVIPAFEASCKTMFEQVDATFQKGLVKHANAAQQHFESMHSPLAAALRDTINAASSITQTLSGEMTDGQRKLLAIAAAGANSNTANPLVTQLSNGPLAGLHEMKQAEAPLDPTKELSRLISERKYEEAFTGALQRSDVSIVSWLCSQVDLHGIFSLVPLPLSQGVLLALLQQLACDISKETPRKLAWMTDVAIAINPADQMIAMHVRPIFEQVYQILGHQRSLPTTSVAEASNIRLLMHVINSVLLSCK